MTTALLQRAGLLAAIVIGSFALKGCGGSERMSRANNELREEVMMLREELEAAERQNAELHAQYETLHQEAAHLGVASALPDDSVEAVPAVVKLRIGRLSHARDTDGDGVADRLILYAHPSDGRARFVQLAGSVRVQAALLPDNAEAITIGQMEFTPEEVRAAYRSSFTGTHYTLEISIELPETYPGEADVRASYTDLRTNQTHEAHRAIELR